MPERGGGGQGRQDAESETLLPVALRLPTAQPRRRHCTTDGGGFDDVAHALRADGFDASEDGTGRGTPLVPVGVALRGRDDGGTAELTGDVMTALRCGGGGGDKPHVLAPMAFAENTRNELRFVDGDGGIAPSLQTQGGKAGRGYPAIVEGEPTWRVRRLTPTECERLQGFPDGYTNVPYRGKPAADGPRYKALGNSMAVNVMRWIGQRIAAVDVINRECA